MAHDQTEPRFGAVPGRRLTVLLKIRDRTHRASTVSALLKAARQAKLAGATVLEGTEGYGRSGHLHRQHLFAEDTPVSVVMVDTREQVNRFLAEQDELLRDLFVTIDDLEIVTLEGSY